MSLIQTSQQLWPNQRCICYKTHYVFDLQFSIAPLWSIEAQYCCWPRFGFWLSPKIEFTKFWLSPKIDFHINQTYKFWPSTKFDFRIYQMYKFSLSPKIEFTKFWLSPKMEFTKFWLSPKIEFTYRFSYKLNLQILTKYKNRF